MANKSPDRRWLLLSGAGLALSGCGGLGLGPTDANDTIYVLSPAPAPAPPAAAASWALAVDIPDASDALDTRRIALIKPDATMDYYANAEWPDRLPILVQTALVAGFQGSGRVAVSRIQDGLHADYELGTELRDASAHYSSADKDGKPGGVPKVSVSIVAQISTAHGRKIVADFTATQSADAGQNSTGAVAQAFNAALGAAVQDIVKWTLGLALAPPLPNTP